MTLARRTLLLVSTALLLASTAHAQQVGRIEGDVRDARGAPVRTAVVVLVGLARSVTTTGDGTFLLDSVSAGERRITVRAVGFINVDTTITVRAGATTRASFRMDPGARELDRVVISERMPAGAVSIAPDVLGAMVLAGAKSEVLELGGSDANLAEKVPRQIFAKVPGLFVYDMDGAGNQVNVSTRGLDAHRSWEMNVRQDGVLLNSDLYGYPASHYSPPMEAIQRIVLVRGTAALQYGSQFGGLVDYVTKTPDTTRVATLESINTVGSFNLLSTFNSVGGRAGPITYYGYASARREDGYRDVSQSTSSAQYLSASFDASSDVTVRAQVGRSTYRHRIPGPLTDAMFATDSRTATRSRNWFSPDIIIPAVSLDWHPDSSTRVLARVSGVFGDRSSVQFLGFATVADAPNAQGAFASRVVDIDNFRSRTVEVRATRDLMLGSMRSTLATGLAYSFNDTRRRQQGRGTNGTGYDLSLASGTFGRDLHYRTKAIAAYVESIMRVTPRFTIVPGARFENGRTRMDGYLSYYDPSGTPRTIDHVFPLVGVRAEFRQTALMEWYGGWSQAYRPMILKDILPENALEQTDPNIRDAKGWTGDFGVRGSGWGGASYDVSAFLMRYDNRFGSILRTDAAGASYLFKTNVGSTLTKGVEARVDLPVVTSDAFGLRAFSATSWFGAFYRAGSVSFGGRNVDVTGNRVESVPEWISRNGVTATQRRVSASALVSYTARTFADPLNTVTPSTSGAVGEVPSYGLLDLNGSVLLGRLRVQAAMSNALDKRYFTKRPAFYPGPGVWPSDGRAFQLSASLVL